MSDLNATFGGDLAIAPHGDLSVTTGSTLGQQRVLRRLLTNAGDYIWQLTYGAGLPAMIGTPIQASGIAGLVKSQIFLESAVARSPAPSVSIEADGNIVSLSISYSDTSDASTQAVGVTVMT